MTSLLLKEILTRSITARHCRINLDPLLKRGNFTAVFNWYHYQHEHSGLGWMTPSGFHWSQAPNIQQLQQGVLESAHEKTFQLFVRNVSQMPAVPLENRINLNHKSEEPGQVDQSLGTDPQTASLNKEL